MDPAIFLQTQIQKILEQTKTAIHTQMYEMWKRGRYTWEMTNF